MLQAFLSLGRWLFILPFAILGLTHFLDHSVMVDLVVPDYLPAKQVFVYFAGAALIAASFSMAIGKYDKLAAVLLAVFILLLVVVVHIPSALDGAKSARILPFLLKDLSLAGAAMLYAQYYAQDRSLIG